ncbi:hypothetical protein D3C87_2110650 [compost metagenome]
MKNMDHNPFCFSGLGETTFVSDTDTTGCFTSSVFKGATLVFAVSTTITLASVASVFEANGIIKLNFFS